MDNNFTGNHIEITDQTGKLIQTKNNSKMFEYIDKQNKIIFLDKIINDKFDSLDRCFQSKELAKDCIKKLVLTAIGSEICASIVCYDGINTLIPMTGILLLSVAATIKPIKLIKESNKNIEFYGQVIPCLQEQRLTEVEEAFELKKDIKNFDNQVDKFNDYENREYSEDDLVYTYSKDKKRVKVRLK